MDRSYPYSRRLISRARLRKRMAAVMGAGLAGMAVLFALGWETDPISARTRQPLLAVADAAPVDDPRQAGVRRIYPYSVVPGGVSGQAELARVIRTDRVVAVHYASFDVDKARAVVVDKPRAVHVSYRRGDKVYWTAGKVMLAPGETLLSDGRNEMRARCANRISDLPQYPVEDHQPAMEELDHPVELGANEGGQYALEPDGLPVSMSEDGAIPRHIGQHAPGRAGSAAPPGAPGSTPASATLPHGTHAFSATDGGALTTMSLSGSSSSMGSRPRPVASPGSGTDPDPASLTGADSVGASSGSGATPVPQPGSEAAATTPQPDAGMPPATPVAGPDFAPQPVPGSTPAPAPAPLPGIDLPPALIPVPGALPGAPQAGGGTPDEPGTPALPSPGNGPLFPEPDTVTEPFIPKPDVGPTPPPTDIEQPAPSASVAEPGSIWLGGAALAAMLGLRRRPAVLRPGSSVPPPPPAAP